MLDSKKIKESVQHAKNYVKDGAIQVKGDANHVKFFLSNAENSLNAAESLLDHTIKGDYNGSLWVINASYYAMFYTVRTLLESAGITLKRDLSIHVLTFDALIYFFYESKKLERRLCELFAEAQVESAELLGKQVADDLVQNYLWEKKKRGIFTYEVGEVVMQSKAQTSYDRALRFNADIRALIA